MPPSPAFLHVCLATQVWEWTHGAAGAWQRICTFPVPSPPDIVALSPCGRLVAVGHSAGTLITLFGAATGWPLQNLHRGSTPTKLTGLSFVTPARRAPAAQRPWPPSMLIACSATSTVHVFDIRRAADELDSPRSPDPSPLGARATTHASAGDSGTSSARAEAFSTPRRRHRRAADRSAQDGAGGRGSVDANGDSSGDYALVAMSPGSHGSSVVFVEGDESPDELPSSRTGAAPDSRGAPSVMLRTTSDPGFTAAPSAEDGLADDMVHVGAAAHGARKGDETSSEPARAAVLATLGGGVASAARYLLGAVSGMASRVLGLQGDRDVACARLVRGAGTADASLPPTSLTDAGAELGAVGAWVVLPATVSCDGETGSVTLASSAATADPAGVAASGLWDDGCPVDAVLLVVDTRGHVHTFRLPLQTAVSVRSHASASGALPSPPSHTAMSEPASRRPAEVRVGRSDAHGYVEVDSERSDRTGRGMVPALSVRQAQVATTRGECVQLSMWVPPPVARTAGASGSAVGRK